MTPGIHEYEYSRLPVLMNMNNVFKYKCVSNLQVKPGYTRKSPGIPEKYPSARPHAAHLLPGSLRQLRRAPPAQVRAPHHVCSLQVPKRKRQHQRQATACRRRCGRRGRATFCYKIEAVLRMRLCDPDQLIGKKRRNKLTAADTLFATSRAVSLERMNTTRVSPTHAGWLELEELYENCGSQD